MSDEELREIEALDLSQQPKLERVRDLFLVGCYTGLRYSDYSVLKPGTIQNDLIEIIQVKKRPR